MKMVAAGSSPHHVHLLLLTAQTGETSRVTGDLVLQKAEISPKIPQFLPLLLTLCDSRA